MKGISRTFAYVLGLLALLMLGGTQATSAQGTQGRAGLVVQFGDGTVRSYCIAFEGESITGMDLLLRSGLEVNAEMYGGMGGLVCKIGAEGCDYPGEVCACKSYGPNGVYWTYHHLRDGVWKSSSVGAGGYRVRNGEVDGWAWSSGRPPVVRTFGQLCGAAQPQATNTSKPTIPTPRPQPTSTPKPPTATRQPPKPTNIVRAATPTRVPSKPQATSTRPPQPARPSPTKTAVRKPSPTRQPIRLFPTATPKRIIVVPTSTKRPIQATSTPTRKHPTATKTRTPTRSTIPTRTSTPTRTPTRPSAPTQANTPIAALTTNDPPRPPRADAHTPNPRPPASDTARTVSLAIGATVIGGLLVWGGVNFASRRTSAGKRDRNTHAG